MAGFVFVQPGQANTKTFNKVNAGKPCVLMITKKDPGYTLTLSDPTHLQTKIVIGLQGNKKSQTGNSNYDAGKNITFFDITLPQGAEAGKTIEFIIK